MVSVVRVCVGMQDMHNELQDVMGQSFGVPDDIDESELMGELDALEDELAMEAENPTAGGVPSYLQVCDAMFETQDCVPRQGISNAGGQDCSVG